MEVKKPSDVKEVANINQALTKPQQSKEILNYLVSIIAPAKTDAGIKKQKQDAKQQLAKHFPELAKYV